MGADACVQPQPRSLEKSDALAAVWVSAPSDRLHVNAHAGIAQPAVEDAGDWEANLFPTACRASPSIFETIKIHETTQYKVSAQGVRGAPLRKQSPVIVMISLSDWVCNMSDGTRASFKRQSLWWAGNGTSSLLLWHCRCPQWTCLAEMRQRRHSCTARHRQLAFSMVPLLTNMLWEALH